MENNCEKIKLGTAQFGQNYGINSSGRPSYDDVASILDRCLAIGITDLDSSINYGCAHELLGVIGVKGFGVSTKFAITQGLEVVEKQFFESLDCLGINSFDTVSIHDTENLSLDEVDGGLGLFNEWKSQKLLRKVGISVYEPKTLLSLLESSNFQSVQAPLNPFDKRFSDPYLVNRLVEKDITLEARSIFLQGTLASPDKIPPSLNDHRKYFEVWRNWLDVNKISALKACLDFAMNGPSEKILIGVDSLQHLDEIIECCLDDGRCTTMKIPDFAIPCGLFDPRRWPVATD